MERLKNLLGELSAKHGLVALKAGTEVEDMTFREIEVLQKIGNGLPLIVKIGGPEARNDMRNMKSMGVNGILAPMIESAYALKNFVESIHDIYSIDDRPYLAINVETITAYNNLGAIVSNTLFACIDQITVGRSDLSNSMNKPVDDDQVLAITKEIVRQARKAGKLSSVGGAINPANAAIIREKVRPDRVNTRHLAFDMSADMNILTAIKSGLTFEIELYRAFKDIEPSKAGAYENRIEKTLQRMSAAEKTLKRKVS